jgi:HK97 family phage portal protein
MKITERIKSAYKVLTRGVMPNIYAVQQNAQQWGLYASGGDKTEMLKHYTSWVYACVSIRAKAAASAQFRVFVKRGANDFEELSVHPLITLMEEMNTFETKGEVIHKTIQHLDLTGDAYWYVPKNGFGVPAEVWVLPPDKMKIIPDSKNIISGYELNNGPERIRFSPDEIIHFKYPNPCDFFYGASPLMAAAMAVDIDTFQRTFQRNFYANSAAPQVVLKTEQRLDDTVYRRLKADWERMYRGEKNSGKIAILENGLNIEPVGINPKDLDWLSTNKVSRDSILAIYGVPASKLGLVEDVNRANAEANDYTFRMNVVEPILTMLDERLTQDLARQFDEKLVVRHREFTIDK